MNTQKNTITEFGKYFKKIVNTNDWDIYCGHDYEATGLTTSNMIAKIFIEEKCRKKYDIFQYSAATIIEKVKYDHYVRLLNDNPNCIILFNVFSADGWIVYNITNRLRDKKYVWNWQERLLPDNTQFRSSRYVYKLSDTLAWNKNYKDKINLYYQ